MLLLIPRLSWALTMPDPTPANPNLSNCSASRRLRVSAGTQLECRKGSHGMGADLTRALLKLSPTGGCLLLALALDPGQEVEVLIRANGLARPLRRLARVVWAAPVEDGYSVSIRFDNALSYADMRAVAGPPRVLR
jgi:hypothetical protein